MKLVSVADYGIKGINYYWERREMYDLSEAELQEVGVTNNRVMVDEKIISKLVSINELLKSDHGFELFIKEGYRSEDLYELIFQKRSEKFGLTQTLNSLNMNDMPHSTGLSVDVGLISLDTGTEVEMRDKTEGVPAFYVHYYKYNDHPKADYYSKMQELLKKVMYAYGFYYGSKLEYWHFQYPLKTSLYTSSI